ncbi:MAG: glycosyltransferase [Planctomycetes bacterium]|nr:glycosyltransferase [Planctomycetota bacterium]
MKGRSLLPKAAATSARWVADTVGTFVVTAAVYRALGEGSFGVWATLVALRAVLLLADHGLALGVSRDAALAGAGDAVAWSRVRAAVRVYLLAGAAAVAVGVAAAGVPRWLLAGAPVPGMTTAFVLLALEAGIAMAFGPLLGIVRGRERFELVAGTAVVQNALGAGLVLLWVGEHGLVGAALATCVARLAALGGLAVAAARAGLLRGPAGAGVARLRTVAGFAIPLWIAAAGGYLAQSIDVPVVAGIFGDETAGRFALGSRLAGAGAGLLFAALSATFPSFVTAPRTERGARFGAVVFLGAALATAGFGCLWWCGEDLLRCWVGAAPALAREVLLVYALVWIVNVPAHVLASLSIAADRHRTLAVVALVAAPTNFGLSLVAAHGGFASGPAWVSLGVIVVSNWLVVPRLLLPRLALPRRAWLRPAVSGYAAGLAAAAVGAGAGALAHGAAWWVRAAIVCAVAFGVLAAVLDLTVRPRSTLRLWYVRTQRGGWRVWRRQRREALCVRRELRADPTGPTIFAPQAPPLVTVRIATYNRGQLVAERALASAIAQTHANLEIVVVGDHCDEATERAVRSVRDPRIRFVNLPERGRYPDDPELRWMVAGSIPMSHGVGMARGDWIAPLDDDDSFTPDHVEVLLGRALERRADFVWGVAEMEQDDGDWTRRGSWPLRRGRICHSAVLFSRRLAAIRHDVEAWRLDEPGDWNLWTRFRRAGARMAFVDRVVVRHYRERRGVVDATPFWLGSRAGVATGAGALGDGSDPSRMQ